MHNLDQTTLEMEGFQSDGEQEGYGEPGPEVEADAETPFDTAREMELAGELLEVSSEQELEQYLGDLIRHATRRVRQFARTPTGKALGAILRNAAKEALPVIGRAVGERVSHGRGGRYGERAGRAAGDLLGLELEGLSREDREFEAARGFVRFAGAAARHAVQAEPGASPVETARRAVVRAARVHAPGLLSDAAPSWPRAGRWVRHGRTIVVYAD